MSNNTEKTKPLLKDHPLARFVTDSLASLGHPNPEGWLVKTNEPVMGNDAYVRIQVNNRLRQALGELDAKNIKSTILERSCLINDGSEQEWRTLLTEGVLPLITQYKLPSSQ